MNYIIIALILIVFALLSFIYYLDPYLFARRKKLIKNTPVEIENFLIILNKKIDGQFKDTNKYIKTLEKNHEKHQKYISNKISIGADTVEHKIKTEFQSVKNGLDKFKKDLHNKIEKNINALERLSQSGRDIAERNKLSLEKTDKCIRSNLLVQLSDMKNQLDALQEYALSNNQKIRRFEDGYDLKIQNEFVIDIINTIEYLKKQNKKSKNNDLETAIEDLNIMLENNSIYKMEINNGDSYRGQEIMVKVVSTELTENTSKDYVIKEILKDGYYIEINDIKKMVKPAEVVIYKTKEKK